MKKWPWLLYGCFLTLIVVGSLGDIFDPTSPMRSYYTVLIAFNKSYVVYLTLNIISIVINLSTPLVVFLYAFDIKSSVKFWQIFFFIRLGIDLVGHHYDIQFIKSSYFQNLSYFFACIGVFTFPIIPSYMAHYLYAFKKQNPLNN